MCTHYRTINNILGSTIQVKCGHCPACLYDKQVELQSRILHSNPSSWTDRYDRFFVTLTYENNALPMVKRADFIDFVHDAHEYFSMCDRKDFYDHYPDEYLRIYDDPPVIPEYRMLPIYRFRSDRKVKCHSGIYRNVVTPGRVQIGEISFKDVANITLNKKLFPWDNLSEEEQLPDNSPRLKIGYNQYIKDPLYTAYMPVCFYKDFQDYLKRVRINYARYYGKGSCPEIRTFQITEYGETTFRPHLHAEIQVPKGHYQAWKRTLVSSWTYDRNLRRKVEPAVTPASYLSTYVNSYTSVPSVLRRCRKFTQKSRSSKFYGLACEEFSLPSVLDKFRKNDFSYYEYYSNKDGVTERLCQLPKRAISRFFPKFEGFNRLHAWEIYDLLVSPEKYVSRSYTLTPVLASQMQCNGVPVYPQKQYYKDHPEESPLSYCSPPGYVIRFSDFDLVFEFNHEINRFFSFLEHQKRKALETGLFKDVFDFAKVYSQIWTRYSSFSLKFLHRDDKSLEDFYSHIRIYDNSGFASWEDVDFNTLPCDERDVLLQKEFLKIDNYAEYMKYRHNNKDDDIRSIFDIHPYDMSLDPEEIQKNKEKKDKFFWRDKRRKVINQISSQFINV